MEISKEAGALWRRLEGVLRLEPVYDLFAIHPKGA